MMAISLSAECFICSRRRDVSGGMARYPISWAIWAFWTIFAAVEEELAPVADGHVHALLNPVDVGGERGDDDPPGGLGKDLFQRLADDLLGGGESLPFGIRRIGEEGQHPRSPYSANL